MVKKPKQPAETAELKKQIETIVGHEIDPGVEPIIKFSSPAGSYTFFVNHGQETETTSRDSRA